LACCSGFSVATSALQDASKAAGLDPSILTAVVRVAVQPARAQAARERRRGELSYPYSVKSNLTVKLRGRPEVPIKRRGRILSSSARGATPQAVHGPLQRLLVAIPTFLSMTVFVCATYTSLL
jgi:hypothetical protein